MERVLTQRPNRCGTGMPAVTVPVKATAVRRYYPNLGCESADE